jgi:hypothetical protein
MSGKSTIAPADLPLTRARLQTLPRRRLHSGRNVSKATVDLIEVAGARCVVKDFASRSWPVRRILGPWQLSREERAYARLAGLPGVPRFLARIDRQAMALEFIDGRRLQGMRRGDVEDPFFDRLEALVGAVHSRGVAHGDLHHGDVLVGPGGAPFLIDFSTSFLTDPDASLPRRWVFQQLQAGDRRGVAKLRHRLAKGGGPEPPRRSGISRVLAGVRRLYRRALLIKRTLLASPHPLFMQGDRRA